MADVRGLICCRRMCVLQGLEQRILAVVMHRLYPRIEQQKRQLIITKGTQVCTALPSTQVNLSSDVDLDIAFFLRLYTEHPPPTHTHKH